MSELEIIAAFLVRIIPLAIVFDFVDVLVVWVLYARKVEAGETPGCGLFVGGLVVALLAGLVFSIIILNSLGL